MRKEDLLDEEDEVCWDSLILFLSEYDNLEL